MSLDAAGAGEARPDFWLSSGFHLLDRDADGRLAITPDFIRAYLSRPEMMPPDEACQHERALHALLLREPENKVAPADLARLADADAQENFAIFLRFRDLLLQAGTAEAAYCALFRPGAPAVPSLFIDQLAAVILRGLLESRTDPFQARAAELFFRTQRSTIRDGSILLADEETVEGLGRTGGFGSLGSLVAQAGTPLREIEMDILTKENGDGYWARSDRHDMVLDISFTRPGQDAFARVIEAWIGHLVGAEVQVQPVQTIRDERWVWHIGLDAEASAIMNALYDGADLSDDRLKRVLALFRLDFRDPSLMLPRVAGRSAYLGLAQDANGNLRMKPQNLVVNLPLNTGN
jgi:hypothetical protein